MSRKYIDIREFREFGLLQELNRQFLHPLGMALEIIQNPDGTEILGNIWDSREDDEGFCFSDLDKDKMSRVLEFQEKKFELRKEKLGYIIQTENWVEPNKNG